MKAFSISQERMEELEELGVEIKQLIIQRCELWEAEALLEYLLWSLRDAEQQVARAKRKEKN